VFDLFSRYTTEQNNYSEFAAAKGMCSRREGMMK
jgi:hypothetical protein